MRKHTQAGETQQWRKYGQCERFVKGMRVQTCYFSCKEPGCRVKRKVEIREDGTRTEREKHQHNHHIYGIPGADEVAHAWDRAAEEDFLETTQVDDAYAWVKYGQKVLKRHNV